MTEQKAWTADVATKAGRSPTQVKLFDPFPRRGDKTLAEFSKHWNTIHAGIAKSQIPQILHYVQSHRIDEKPAVLGAPLGETWCDGSSETWYDSPATVEEMLPEPGVAALMKDEENFMDLSITRYPVLTTERLVDAGRFEEGQQGVKALLFVRRPHGVSVEEFQEAWLDDDDAVQGRKAGVTRHVVCPAVKENYTFLHPNPEVRADQELPYDGVRELWWPDAASVVRAGEEQPEAMEHLLHPAAIDVPRSFVLFARERVIIP